MLQKQDQNLPAGLYIIATPIGNLSDISLRALDTLNGLDVLACEDTRESGKLTAAYNIKVSKIPYHDHNADKMRPRIVDMIKQGRRIGLISDAGLPLISDPGYKLVEACLEENLYVTCIPGATASLTALILSGLPADKFMFAGFLPPKSAARKSALAALKTVPATLIFYETAPRLIESLEDMQAVLGDRPAAVARELTKKFEETRRGTLAQLSAHYAEKGTPKGEIVIVIGAPGALAEQWADKDIDLLLQKSLEEDGLSVKDAAALASLTTGVKKSVLYQRALILRNKKK